VDLFGEKKYSELDWLTKAVQPISWGVSEKLNLLPDTFDVDYEVVKSVVCAYSMRIEPILILPSMLKSLNIKLTDEEKQEIVNCYKVVMEGKIEIDFENETMTGGTMTFTKIKESFTDEELQKKMGHNGIRLLRGIYESEITGTPDREARLDEVLDLIGGKTTKRLVRKKLRDLYAAYENGMVENKWNVRSIELSDRIALWIKVYIMTGNLAAFTNFCKFKAVTHRGYPIYSIEEETI